MALNWVDTCRTRIKRKPGTTIISFNRDDGKQTQINLPGPLICPGPWMKPPEYSLTGAKDKLTSEVNKKVEKICFHDDGSLELKFITSAKALQQNISNENYMALFVFPTFHFLLSL